MTATASADDRGDACDRSINKVINLCMFGGLNNIMRVNCDCAQDDHPGALTLGIALDVRVPEKRQRDVLALPSASVARHTERVESGFRELSAAHPHPVAEISS
jgi:hypothetical protein